MEKVRIYELAKELNTTSKRLIEKLAEIDINVKNHMSYLDVNELEALYKHIGVVSYDEEKKDEDRKKSSTSTPRSKMEQKKPEVKDSNYKSAPRIIRKTEIVLDEKVNDKYKEDSNRKDGQHGRNRGESRGGRRYGGIKVNTAGTGLRAGYVRDTGPSIIKKDKLPRTDKVQEKPQDTRKSIIESASDDVKMKQAIEEPVTQAIEEPVTQPVEQAVREPAKELISNENEEKKTGGKKISVLPKEEIKKVNVEKKKTENKTGEKEAQKPAQKEQKKVTDKYISRQEYKETLRNKDQQAKTNFTGEKSWVRTGEDMKTMENGKKNEEKHEARSDSYKDKKKAKSTGYTAAKHDRHEALKPDFLEIPKPDIRIEPEESKKFSYKNKEADKDSKREQKRELPRAQISDSKKKKFKTNEIVIDEKRNISQLITDDGIIDNKYEERKGKRPVRAPKRKKEDKNIEIESNASIIARRSTLLSISIPEEITVKELAESLKKTSADVIKKLMNMGIMATLNQVIDYDTAAIVADEFGVKAEKEIIINEEDILFDNEEDNIADLKARPPVVVVMGHVDHGKTSLLDAIRKTNVIKSEEGGITQHIGAYMVKINNRNITFLDTPGHEAFTAMRARGAQATDIAILVVAADDGIMPQTIEAINHAKAADVAIIVAINKIDKPGANPERIKQQLTEHGLVPEEWGGDVIVVPVSALKGENIDLLLEMVLLTADMLELKANPKKQAKGTVIEAKLDKNRGPIATLLVQRGTLSLGNSILAGTILGRIKAMTDDKGQNIKDAAPSTPVEVLGFSDVPESGEIFYAIEDERLAKSLIEKRKQKHREEQLKSSSRVTLEDLFSQIQEGKVKELNIIIKADVQGSVEAVKQSMEKLSNDEVKINVIHGGAGGITETDVKLAEVSNAIIIGFNVRPGINVSETAKSVNVDIRLYRIIYDAIEDIEAAMKGMLEPKLEEVIHGHAEVRQLFKASGIGVIGGSYVLDGKITRNSGVRVVRDSIVVYEGKLASLKRFKDDIREVSQGYECGILIEKFNDIKEGDIVEAYAMEEVQE
ncbi:MAG TPA: translation initiation factor IF-2 [Clostridiales bacterium]|nr:translation initiation factor IF-2 [Clostridiales bacterium]